MSTDTRAAGAAVDNEQNADPVYDDEALAADVEFFRERLRHVVNLLDHTRDPLTAANYILSAAQVIRPLCYRLETAVEASSSLN